MKITIDFETASFCDLKLAGAWRYAEDPNTEVLSMAYQGEGCETYIWTPGCFDDDLRAAAADPSVIFVSHASFEQAIWKYIMVEQHGFAPIPIARWEDTQATCALHAIPLDLDHALTVMNLPVVKDLEGRKVTLALSRMDKKTGMLPTRTPELMEKVYAYNKVDVAGTVELARTLGVLPRDERRVWEIDQAINQRGVALDLPLVQAARDLCVRASGPLVQEFTGLTGGLQPTQGAKFLEWLGSRGVYLPNLQKATVAAVLGEETDDATGEENEFELVDLPDDARRALYIRSLVSSASIKKLDRMAACVGFDGRARGLLQYHAAHPGRWAGRILQPQNFPRGTVKADPEAKVNAILRGAPGEIREEFGCDPIELVVSSLRHILVAKPAHVLVAADYASIEARVVLALSGQHDKTELMASGVDVYCDMASRIFKRTITKDAEPEARQTGKNTVLGCGFQMGWKTFRARYCSEQPEEFAQRVIQAYRKEWAPLVPKLWAGLEDAALKAAHNPGQAFWSHGIAYKVKDIGGRPFMVCRLLDGKCLYYFDPRTCVKRMPWSTEEKPDVRPTWKYRAKRLGQWTWVDAYGGILTENVVQALARQILCRAMERLDAAGWPIVLTVHDEVVAEMPAGHDWEPEMAKIMTAPVDWATNIKVPIAVETWQGERYKK